MVWLRCMYYERINTDVIDLEHIVIIKVENSSDAVLNTHIKSGKVMDNVKDDKSVWSQVPRAFYILGQEVRRLGRTVRQTKTYNPMTGKADKSIMPVSYNWIMSNCIQSSRSRTSI